MAYINKVSMTSTNKQHQVMKVLFIFMDGVGLGENNPDINPFVTANLPTLDGLLEGEKLVARDLTEIVGTEEPFTQHSRASLLSLDACLGIDGLPQSATGQASLLTGINVPAVLKAHEGPKPNPPIMEILQKGTLFSELIDRNRQAALLNAYPPRYFNAIDRGYRIPGVIALAAKYAHIQLRTKEDLYQGEAISADFTGHGWREQLGFQDAPLLTLMGAGERIAYLANGNDLALFEYWLSDMAGHQRDMVVACRLLEQWDEVMGSLVERWNDEEGLILVTSDHGNLEDLSTRHHTRNDVPLIMIGSKHHREEFTMYLTQHRESREKLDLTDITPAIFNLCVPPK